MAVGPQPDARWISPDFLERQLLRNEMHLVIEKDQTIGIVL